MLNVRYDHVERGTHARERGTDARGVALTPGVSRFIQDIQDSPPPWRGGRLVRFRLNPKSIRV